MFLCEDFRRFQNSFANRKVTSVSNHQENTKSQSLWGSPGEASANGVNNTGNGAEATLSVTEGVAAREAEPTRDQRQGIGAITTTISQLLAALSTAGIHTVADSVTSGVTDVGLGGTQPTEETCQFTGLLGKPALSATGVCAGTGVSAVGQEGNNSQGHGGFERVHDVLTWLGSLWSVDSHFRIDHRTVKAVFIYCV